jgi:ATP-dependent Clp protease ATP-binding subunit ClpX
MDTKSMGFLATITEKREENIGELLKNVLPQDLIRFGLIPEFIGRVPIVVSLNALDRDAMIRILTEPKNAIIRQYQKLFELDGVNLTFEQDAVAEIADKTIERKIGARGLRSIIENAMLDVMFEIPSMKGVTGCVMTKAAIDKEQAPTLIYAENGKPQEDPPRKGRKKKSLEETA